jgi:transcriptional regulator with XRE-family HTH domain
MAKPPPELDPLVSAAVARRHAMGRTQASVADEMRTTQSAVSQMELGQTTPSVCTLRRYLRALGLDLAIVALPGTPEVTDGR